MVKHLGFAQLPPSSRHRAQSGRVATEQTSDKYLNNVTIDEGLFSGSPMKLHNFIFIQILAKFVY